MMEINGDGIVVVVVAAVVGVVEGIRMFGVEM